MNEKQVLESVEAGLDRLLVKSDVSGEADLSPGLRVAIVYIRSRIDASIDSAAASVIDRALPAPEQGAEGAQEPPEDGQEPIETQETQTGTFEPVASAPRKRRNE